MKLLTAVKFIILAHASCCVPSVLCTKGRMSGNNTTATTEDDNTDERKLASSSSTDYEYLRNYLTIIEPENFVTVFPNGAPNIGTGVTSLVGSSTIQKGGVYDPADIEIVNKLNGVGPDDLTDEVIESFGGNEGDALEAIGGFKFGGGRQPKQPVPPGDSAFFYHGECVATSAINSPSPFPQNKRQLASGGLDALNAFLASFTVTSHTCNLNICLGGGGFNCIAFYSGTSFVFDLGEQISRSNPKLPTRQPTRQPTQNPAEIPTLVAPMLLTKNKNLSGGVRDLSVEMPEPFNGEIKLPPPFPSTIIGGTGRYVQFKV